MIKLLLAILLALLAAPAFAKQDRPVHIHPELVVNGAVEPGKELELAILMSPERGWHGYWANPGDAGLPMRIEWTAPRGLKVDDLRYPMPERLTIAGLMNYVFNGPYAVLTRITVPRDAKGTLHIVGVGNWLACTDKVCVPESKVLNLRLPVGARYNETARFDRWRQMLPQPLSSHAHFQLAGDKLRLAIPLPASVTLGEPYVFPLDDGPVDYAAPQSFRRSGDTLIAELERRRGEPARFAGVLALGGGAPVRQ